MVLQSNFSHFDDIGIDAVSGCIKPTIRSPVAVLFTRFALWAAMSIHTFGVIAFEPEATRSHASDSFQDEKFVLG